MNPFEILLSLEEKELSPEEQAFIYHCLSDADPLVRCQAADLLPDLPHTEQNISSLLSMCDDEDALVRTEVYDVLSGFPDKRIPVRLKKAILTEPDELARSFAVMSWADSVSDFVSDFSEQIQFIQKYRNTETSEGCLLACAYALYQFQSPESLALLLSFLHSQDYHIRCSAVNSLKNADEQDLPVVFQALRDCYISEETKAVASTIEEFFREHKK